MLRAMLPSPTSAGAYPLVHLDSCHSKFLNCIQNLDLKSAKYQTFTPHFSGLFGIYWASRAIIPFVPDHHLVHSNILSQTPLPHANSSNAIDKPSYLSHLVISRFPPSCNNMKALSDLLESIMWENMRNYGAMEEITFSFPIGLHVCLFKPINMEMAKKAFKHTIDKRLHLRLLNAFPSPSIVVAYRFISVQILHKKVSGQNKQKNIRKVDIRWWASKVGPYIQ